jgi:sugar (pentulose or hexulose) kinase
MRHYLGIDIGTYASKGALVDQSGRIVAEASRPHRMIVPQAGWAEHRPREDWWNDFTAISRQLMSESGIAPADIRSVACSAIGPCMLTVDAVGEPLMNAVLYGVDTRAAAEIEELTTQIGEKSLVEHCDQALTSQSVGPKILWLHRNRPEIFARTAKIVNSTTYLVWKLTGRYVLDHYSAINTGPIYLAASNEWSDVLAPDLLPLEKLPELYGRQKSPEESPKRPQRSPDSRSAPRSPPAPSTRPQKPSASACSIPATCLLRMAPPSSSSHWLPAESVIGESGTRNGSFPASTQRRRASPPAEP